MKRLRLTRSWLAFLVVAAVGAAIAIGATKPPKETEVKVSGPLKQTKVKPQKKVRDNGDDVRSSSARPDGAEGLAPTVTGPRELHLVKATSSFDGDLRRLPTTEPEKIERPEHEAPEFHPIMLGDETVETQQSAEVAAPQQVAAPAPPPIQTFEGMNFAANGAGHPPDTNGDVGPNHYIQTINTSIAVYDKTGNPLAGPFTFNSFFAGHFGNLCDTNNFGDPVVVYDTFEDRWVITDFAFILSSGAVVNPPRDIPVLRGLEDGGSGFRRVELLLDPADRFLE